MSVFLDKQSRNWKLKVNLDGKDKRITLRKARPSEPPHPIPDDVVALAAAHRGSSVPASAPTTSPTPLQALMVDFLADYALRCRPRSVKKVSGVLRHFSSFLATLPGVMEIGEISQDTIKDVSDRTSPGTITRCILLRGQSLPQFLRRQLEEFPETQVGHVQAQQSVRRLALAAAGPEPTKVPVQTLQVQ